jgi:RNA polymerase sigma factor (TIGR02999 family)
MSETPELTDLLEQAGAGDQAAVARIAPLVYEELRTLASNYLRRERQDHTLQTTALVHEAYLRMVDQTRVEWANRAHFLGVAATMMRRILVNHARDKNRIKRGGQLRKIEFEDAVLLAERADVDLVSLDDALNRLSGFDSEKVRLVELRFFAGCSFEDTARILGKSEATVKREWSLAKAWLRREINLGSTAPESDL